MIYESQPPTGEIDEQPTISERVNRAIAQENHIDNLSGELWASFYEDLDEEGRQDFMFELGRKAQAINDPESEETQTITALVRRLQAQSIRTWVRPGKFAWADGAQHVSLWALFREGQITEAQRQKQSQAETPQDIEALTPADPEIMVSPEGDKRGLEEIQDIARARRIKLGFRVGEHQND